MSGDQFTLSFMLSVPMSNAAAEVGPASPYWPWALLNGCVIETASPNFRRAIKELLVDETERQERRRAKWRRNYQIRYAKSPEKQRQRFKAYYAANKDEVNRKRRARYAAGKRRKEERDGPDTQAI